MRAPTFMDRIAGAARAFAEPRPAPSGSVGKELGTTGTDIWHGQIDVEYKTELRGGFQGKRWDTYQRMESDGMVAMVLRVIALPIKAAVWRVQPGVGADQRGIEAAEFCTEVINAMRPKWSQFLSEAVEYWGEGLRLFEIVWGHRDGKIVLEKLGSRLPQTVYSWHTDDVGDLVQVEQRVYGSQQVETFIDADKLLRFTHRQRGSDFEGRGWKRDVWKHWELKGVLEKIAMVAADRNGVGVWIAYTLGAMSPTEESDLDTAISNLRAGSQPGIRLDKSKVEMEFHTTQRVSMIEDIGYHDARIAQAGLVHFQTLGENTVGSHALAQTGFDLYMVALDGIATELAETFQEAIIEPMVRWNFGPNVVMPRLEFKLREPDGKQLAEVVEVFVRAGVLKPDASIEDLVREVIDLPPRTEDAEDEPATAARAVAPAPAGTVKQIEPLRLQEFGHDPTRDGSGFSRALTSREQTYKFREMNSEWDGFVGAMSTRLVVETDAAVEAYLRRLRRALSAGELATVRTLALERKAIADLSAVFREATEQAVEWARVFVAEQAGLPPVDLAARMRTILAWNWQSAVRRWVENVTAALSRRMLHDQPLQADLVAGAVGQGTIDRVLSDARTTYSAMRASQATLVSKATVGGGIHGGLATVLDHARVVKVQRSAVLDAKVCRNCKTLDGLVFEKADAPRIGPPDKCMGGSLCRCLLIPILDDESPQPETTTVDQVPPLDTPRLEEHAHAADHQSMAW